MVNSFGVRTIVKRPGASRNGHMPNRDGQIARRALARTARLLPVNNQAMYRVLRLLYRCIPLSLERKMAWAQHLLLDVPELQQVAYRVARADGVPPYYGSYTSASLLESPLLPRGRRILVVEHRLPTPDRNSSSVRLYAILKLMRDLDWEVTFVSDSKRSDYHWALANIQRELPYYEQALSRLGIPFIYGMEGLIEHLRTAGRRYQFAWLSYPEVMHLYAPLVRAFMPDAKLLYDTVDLHALRFEREAAARGNDPGLQHKAQSYSRMEWANAECADTVIAVTATERNEILRNVPSASVEVIPNIHTVSPKAVSPKGRDGLLFIGHYLHTPNEDAVLYFLNDILPVIRRHLHHVPFYILGSSMPARFKQYRSGETRAIGYVEDLEPWFSKARVFVAPLRYGAGMKGKIGQSLGQGLPVVTTSVGVEGMHLEDGKNVLIADRAEDFAQAVVRLYQDSALWTILSANGKAHVAAHFSETVAREALARLLGGNADSESGSMRV